jgi:hypothetical protein
MGTSTRVGVRESGVKWCGGQRDVSRGMEVAAKREQRPPPSQPHPPHPGSRRWYICGEPQKPLISFSHAKNPWFQPCRRFLQNERKLKTVAALVVRAQDALAAPGKGLACPPPP